MLLRAEITTSCRTENTRFTRLNALGWATVCPYARDLLWHGSTPIQQIDYPTADESKQLHENLKKKIREAINSIKIPNNVRILSEDEEYEHEININREGIDLCAKSKADLIYTLSYKNNGKNENKLFKLYVEVSSTRINIAKPCQAILRGIALYYETRIPVGIIIVSPEKIIYKVLNEEDQKLILKKLNKRSDNFMPHPNLCSLCEFAYQCPYKAI